MRKSRRLRIALGIFGGGMIAWLSLAACAPETPKLVEKPKGTFEKVSDKGDTKLIFTPRVDILFVVDDSGSMMNHQTNLATNIGLYTSEIEKNQILDYHVGVITSSMDGWSIGRGAMGRLIGPPIYIDRNTPGGPAKLAANLLVGTNGSASEKFFAPVRAALTPPVVNDENRGFYRPEAYLALIFITDTDDQSEGTTPRVFYDWLTQLKGEKDKILLYAAYIPSTDSQCERSGEEMPQRLEELFRLGGGKAFGLCDLDYGQKLAGISADLVNRVGKTLYLSRPPDVSTIVVRYGTQTIPNDARVGWTYDPSQNALVFGPDIQFTEQPEGTEVEVNFIAAEY